MVVAQAALSLVHVPLSLLVMGVKAVFPGPAAREMLDGDGHALRCDTGFAALDSGHQAGDHFRDQGRVLAKGAVGALPAGVRHGVRHVHVALLQTHRVPFPADALREGIHQSGSISLHGRGDSHGARPGRKYPRRVVHAEHHLAVLVAGVGGDHHGDAVGGLLSCLV